MYRGFRDDELEYQYNPRVSVPEYPALAKRRAEQSRAVRERSKAFLNVPYGDTARQVVDIFPADPPGGPVLVYVHGGYWRGGGKDENCNFVPAFAGRGATVAIIEYDLCPQVTVSDIVRETRAALAWIYRNVRRYGGNPSRIHVCGHSAGAHLGAMALAHDWQTDGLPGDLIKGAALTSGVYDLEMVMRVSVNDEIRMTPELARENSPFLHPPRPVCPILVAVGGAEPKGWQQMSEDFFELCREQGANCEYLVVPGANHYTMSDHMADPESPLTRAIFQQMGV
ncbi:MAG TPA: alpha/beta hydrolase [Candidatus Eisenbacteria bacterium]|nr:alpha/beta hydrolase [Candidatus Eisenbacteria bacterium]